MLRVKLFGSSAEDDEEAKELYAAQLLRRVQRDRGGW